MSLASQLVARFGEAAVDVAQPRGEITLEVAAGEWLAACTALRDEYGFDTFIDLCGVDYLSYGDDEWRVQGSVGSSLFADLLTKVVGGGDKTPARVAVHPDHWHAPIGARVQWDGPEL